MRSSKIRPKDFFSLIGFGTWIGQGDGVGTGTGTGIGDGFSPGSKPREPLFLFYFNILLSLRGQLPFHLILKKSTFEKKVQKNLYPLSKHLPKFWKFLVIWGGA